MGATGGDAISGPGPNWQAQRTRCCDSRRPGHIPGEPIRFQGSSLPLMDRESHFNHPQQVKINAPAATPTERKPAAGLPPCGLTAAAQGEGRKRWRRRKLCNPLSNLVSKVPAAHFHRLSPLARSRGPGCDSPLFFVVVRSRRHARRNKGQWISPTVVPGNERFHQLQLP